MNGKEADSSGIGIYKGDVSSEIKPCKDKAQDKVGAMAGLRWRFVVNGERCVKCGACAMDCPVQIIVEQPQQIFIGNGCIGCGDCYEICPVGAIERVKSNE